MYIAVIMVDLVCVVGFKLSSAVFFLYIVTIALLQIMKGQSHGLRVGLNRMTQWQPVGSFKLYFIYFFSTLSFGLTTDFYSCTL